MLSLSVPPLVKSDLGRVGADQGGDLRPGLVDGRLGLLPEMVDAGRVSELVAQRRRHPVDDRREQGRRGVVVEIDALHGSHRIVAFRR